MKDKFANDAAAVWGPATRWAAIVPNDNVDMPEVPKAIRSDTAGVVVLRGEDDHAEPFVMGEREILPCRVKRVMATGTTPNMGLKALY